MYLPALPVIAVDLHGTAGDIQLTLSAFMIAFGFGQIFYGPAGDRFGRRPVILIGLAIYVVTSIGCAFAAEAGHLVGLRFLQGLAACGGVVLARTMVRDLAEKDQAARAMSLMMACTSIAPMLAPLIGGQILWFLGWRAIFWVLAGDRRAWPRRGLDPAARDAAAGVSPAAGPVVDPEALRRAAPAPRLHGLRLHQLLHVRGAVVVPLGLALRLHRALRHRAARLRPDLRRHGRVHDHRQPAQRPVRAGVRRRQDPALRGDRAGHHRPDGDGAGLDRGPLRHDRPVAVPALLRAADRHHQPDRSQFDGDGAAALSAHGGHGVVADGRHAVRHRRAVRRRRRPDLRRHHRADDDRDGHRRHPLPRVPPRCWCDEA